MEHADAMLQALIGDYSVLPKRCLLEDYVAGLSDVAIDGIVWHEFIAVDPLREVEWAQQLAERLPVPMAIVELVDFSAPDLEARLDAYTQYANVTAVRQHMGWDAHDPRRSWRSVGLADGPGLVAGRVIVEEI